VEPYGAENVLSVREAVSPCFTCLASGLSELVLLSISWGSKTSVGLGGLL